MANTNSRYIDCKTRSNKAKKIKAADKEPIKLVCKTVLDNFSPIIAQAKYTFIMVINSTNLSFLKRLLLIIKTWIQYKQRQPLQEYITILMWRNLSCIIWKSLYFSSNYFLRESTSCSIAGENEFYVSVVSLTRYSSDICVIIPNFV